ncbi:hypothetical protein TCAL_16530 [Tigriopus californicus]|uniref:Uncharacterized protein n=1 Tax=Tigriopus californicus TaxID=6832 RepID=A0A553NT05_TIGCA|nr:hypothetical protein TCAL_16530 [Tigriopus californicus]
MASEEVAISFEAVSLSEERKSPEASATSSVESATLRASSAHPLSRNGIKSATVDHQSNKLSVSLDPE